MSIIAFNQVSLTLGGRNLLDKVNWQIESSQKIALVGRNGAGKSTLLDVLAGHLQIDSGQINQQGNLHSASLIQDVPITESESVYHFLVKPLGEIGALLSDFHTLSQGNDVQSLSACQQKMDALHAWDWLPQVETMATRLNIDKDADMHALSGGMKRRVLLAAALIAKPQLLLLDEPTNHLDIDAIEWLEGYLKNFQGALVVVTHDRRFLEQVADTIVEIDRGKLSIFRCDYEGYLDKKELMLDTERRHDALFDKRLKEEEAWIRQGIKARRTRNEGRVRTLKAMRLEAQARRIAQGQVKELSLTVARSGNIVLEASKLSYQIAGKKIIKDFSFLLTRGDKVGIIGPNGCGKTTLLRLLLKELKPDSGEIRHGTQLELAYFDQLKRQLKEEESVMANVADGADFVTIGGKSKHVATYLKEFLFRPEQFNQPVSTLSGGEKSRLLMARLFAHPVNLLIMDEPTNDLDIDTLNLFEKLLLEYSGTLMLISHDRAFINNVVTSILVFEAEGCFNEYIGGYDDYCVQKKSIKESKVVKAEKKRAPSVKLSFNEQYELKALPQKIETLEAEIHAAHQKMNEADFFKQDAETLAAFHQKLQQNEKALEDLYKRWEALENKQ